MGSGGNMLLGFYSKRLLSARLALTVLLVMLALLGAHYIFSYGSPTLSQSLSTAVSDLSPNYSASDDGPFINFVTLEEESARLRINSTAEADTGYLFVGHKTSSRGSSGAIYDGNGDLVYQAPYGWVMDFRVQRLFDEDVLTFWTGKFVKLGYGYGQVHILNSSYHELFTVTLGGDFVTADGENFNSYIDLHEHYITSRSTMLVMAYNVTPHEQGPYTRVLDNIFYEIDIRTNKVLFKWSALDHVDKIPLEQAKWLPGEGFLEGSPWDAYHMNSVVPAKYGYIVSIRNFFRVIYVNYDGSIRWQLSGTNGEGDFESPDVAFSWQHDVQVYNETEDRLTLTLFNNANNFETVKDANANITTAMVIALDLVNRKASLATELSDPAQPVFSAAEGNVQILEPFGHTLVGYGSQCRIMEFDAQGDVVMSVQFGVLGSTDSYRAFKYPWKGIPEWKPVVVLQNSPEGTADLYMSWNGATEYDNWAVYGLQSPEPHPVPDRRFPLGVYERTGFETKVVLEDLPISYLQIVARKGSLELKSSEIVQV